MSGDYTRFTFKPSKDYSAVLKQQGRVDLDADFNELIEIVDRRWRSETMDIIGHCVVPNTTPDAFLVTPIAMGDFNIGIGRTYVDGIQVENHGLPPDKYLADLGELSGTLPVKYSDQPHLPTPLPPALAAVPNTTDLVYVDVWQREVTVLEDASIREIALGGPDTATRIQAVWQVRVLQNIGAHTCGDSMPIWDQTIAPSAGRLTTSTVAPPASDDPCIIAPSGGYRGLENRLYRVEIHSTGTIGGGAPAKFKWSRNDASIASNVTAIPATTQVKVQSVGRDQVLRFDIGNWIEITDDFREFQGFSGHMAQITKIDEANRILTFAPAIPGTFNFNPADPDRRTRAVCWDQFQGVDASGLLSVVAGPIDIEDGIRVTFTFDPTGSNFKVGDYWVFAARTADGSVELLQNAPPRGVLHHFCQLGFIHWGADLLNTTFDDCRQHWPTADCDCCTVTVGDGIDSRGQFTDIQEAINALGSRGGIVCIGRGFYRVTAGLRLDTTKRNVIIRGMGSATRIAFAPAEGAPRVFLDIQRTEHVRLEDVYVVASNADSLVRIGASHFCEIRDCTLVNVPLEGLQNAARDIELTENSSHCEIVHCALVGGKGVSSAVGQVSELVIRDSRTLCVQASVSLLEVQGVEILHNQLRGLPANPFPNGPGLTRETIDSFQTQVSAALQAAAATANFQAAGVLIFAGNRIVIKQNLITAQVAVLGFLLIDARIQENDILSLVGVFVLFALLLKVEDNFILGLLVGVLQAGITAVVDCTSNEFVGFEGILWMSLVELLRVFGRLLGGALEVVGFAGKGPATLDTTVNLGTEFVGETRGFGMVTLAKIHRNHFLTFTRGIFKTPSVLSADVSIIDNSFLLCAQVGVELGASAAVERLAVVLAPVLSLRHLIQGNSFTVQGTGISTTTPLTFIEQNDFQCPSIAVELNGRACTVKKNSILGLGSAPTPEAGLVNLVSGAQAASIASNRLINPPGHGILIREDVSDLEIDDNVIENANFTAIGTFNEGIQVNRLRVSRNHVEACKGDASPNGLQFGGALAIAAAQDVRLLDNVFVNNSPSPNSKLPWFAVYFADVNGIEIDGNNITGNATAAGLGGVVGAVRLQSVRNVVRVQNNVIRGNGGAAMGMVGSFFQNVAERIVVQNNHFSDGPNQGLHGLNRGLPFVGVEETGSLLFEGNHCIRTVEGAFGADVVLVAPRANVCGNSIETASTLGMRVSGAQLIINANTILGSGRQALLVIAVAAIVTSNLTSGINTNVTTLVRANNVPAP